MPKNFINQSGLPIGLRNNNPGNIRPGDSWRGMIGTNGGFIVFENCSWGLRAMAIDLIHKINNGYNTISKIITRWAPPSENDTQLYITKVSNYTGWNANKVLTPTIETLRPLMRAIMNVELGVSYSSMLSDGDINEGFALIDNIPAPVTVGLFSVTSALFLTALYFLATSEKMPKKAA